MCSRLGSNCWHNQKQREIRGNETVRGNKKNIGNIRGNKKINRK